MLRIAHSLSHQVGKCPLASRAMDLVAPQAGHLSALNNKADHAGSCASGAFWICDTVICWTII